MRIQRPNTPAIPRKTKPRGVAPRVAPNPGMAAAAGKPTPRGAGGLPKTRKPGFSKGGMVKKSNCGASVPPSKKR